MANDSISLLFIKKVVIQIKLFDFDLHTCYIFKFAALVAVDHVKKMENQVSWAIKHLHKLIPEGQFISDSEWIFNVWVLQTCYGKIERISTQKCTKWSNQRNKEFEHFVDFWTEIHTIFFSKILEAEISFWN